MTEDDVAQARQEMQLAAQQLEARLGHKSEKWKRYLRWQFLESQLEAGAESDVNRLETVLDHCQGNHAGLEWPEFAALRSSMRYYLRAVSDWQNEQLESDYRQHVEELTNLLGMADASYLDPSASDTIAHHIAWLELGRQAPDIVKAVRAQFGQPNLVVSVDGNLIRPWGERQVDEQGSM